MPRQMLRRLLTLISEWFATQNLTELIAENLSLKNYNLLELFVFLTLNLILYPCLKRMQHLLVRIGQAMSPQFFTKPMFRLLVPFAWYMVATIWLIPIYITLAKIIYTKQEIDIFSYLFDNFSFIFLIASSWTTILFLIERKKPVLEEWADLKWRKSSQSYLDFCDRIISMLKMGLVFSITFPSILLIVAAFQL